MKLEIRYARTSDGFDIACAEAGTGYPLVVVPSTPYNAKGLMIAAIRDDGPVIVLENKFLGAGARGQVPEEAYTFPIGKCEVVRRGRDVTLCGIGRMTRMCLDAADILAAE